MKSSRSARRFPTNTTSSRWTSPPPRQTMASSLNGAFRIRFNHFDNSPIPVEGFAFDNIQVLSLQPEHHRRAAFRNATLSDGVSTVNFGSVGARRTTELAHLRDHETGEPKT